MFFCCCGFFVCFFFKYCFQYLKFQCVARPFDENRFLSDYSHIPRCETTNVRSSRYKVAVIPSPLFILSLRVNKTQTQLIVSLIVMEMAVIAIVSEEDDDGEEHRHTEAGCLAALTHEGNYPVWKKIELPRVHSYVCVFLALWPSVRNKTDSSQCNLATGFSRREYKSLRRPLDVSLSLRFILSVTYKTSNI